MASADGIPRKWEWLPCNYELKREERGAETYWSLTPIIQLVNPDTKVVILRLNYFFSNHH